MYASKVIVLGSGNAGCSDPWPSTGRGNGTAPCTRHVQDEWKRLHHALSSACCCSTKVCSPMPGFGFRVEVNHLREHKDLALTRLCDRMLFASLLSHIQRGTPNYMRADPAPRQALDRKVLGEKRNHLAHQGFRVCGWERNDQAHQRIQCTSTCEASISRASHARASEHTGRVCPRMNPRPEELRPCSTCLSRFPHNLSMRGKCAHQTSISSII